MEQAQERGPIEADVEGVDAALGHARGLTAGERLLARRALPDPEPGEDVEGRVLHRDLAELRLEVLQAEDPGMGVEPPQRAPPSSV